MPRNPLPALPFPPLAILEQDTPIQADQIHDLLNTRDADDRISLLLRSEHGDPNREGTIFTLSKALRLRIHTTYTTFRNTKWLY